MIIEPITDEEWLTFGYIKCISVKKLKELLLELPDDYLIYTKTLAHTGNLPISTPDDTTAGVIDIGNEVIIYYDDDE